MAHEVLRQRLVKGISRLLGMWLLRGDDRDLVTGLQGYSAVMPESELATLETFVPKSGTVGEQPDEPCPHCGGTGHKKESSQ